MATLIAAEYKQFEDIKHADENGVEFWYARELASVLDYTQWRNFTKVIDKAMLSCQNSGFECADHFVEVSKIVEAGATSKPINDFELSRYACYLIVQNGDMANQNCRYLNLLKKLGLESRIYDVTKGSLKQQMDVPIDWDYVNKKRESFILESEEFLNNAINN